MFTHLPKLLFAIYSTAVNSRQYSRRRTGPALLPKYLPKDGYATLIVGFVRLNGNRFVLPYSAAYKKHHKPVTITIPPVLADKTIKEIRIIPKADARFFEIQYTYQVEAAQRNLNPTHALAIDFGIDNLMTAVPTEGKASSSMGNA